MKKLIITFLVFATCFTANAQDDAIGKFFDKYLDDDRFTSIYVSGRMFEMFSEVAEDEEQEMQKMTKELKGLRILSSDKIDGKKMYNEAIKSLSSKGYDELMKISEGGQEELKFMVKGTGSSIDELLMLVGNEQNFFFMSIVGNIDLKKLSKLASKMNIQGMDQLKELDKQHQ